MIQPQALLVSGYPDPPAVSLFDAGAAGLDAAGLRAWVRAEAAASSARHVARAYCFPFGLLACHDGPVGVDIERIEPCDPGFVESISTPAERALAMPGDPDAYGTSLWSSKEALSKALGDAVRYDPRLLESPLHWPEPSAGPWRALELEGPPGHVAWLCWCEGPDA